MAILNRDEYFERLSTIVGDKSDDESIAFVEDFSDTYNDLTNRATGDGVDWKQKYEENDKMWKERYKNRFFSGNAGNPNFTYPDEIIEEEKKKGITIDDLFETK